MVLPLATPGSYEVVGMHTYATIGTFTAMVTIGTTTGSLFPPISVDVTTTTPQTLTGLPIDGTVGIRSNTKVATLTDLDTTALPSDFTATVTWSDNTTSNATVLELSPNVFTFYAGHTFATSGNFINSIAIFDNRNGIGSSSTFTAMIAPAATSTPFNEIGPTHLTPGAGPNGIALGLDHALWFTETRTGNIGRVDTSGNVTEFAPIRGALTGSPSNPLPTGIASGSDGALWFTDSSTDDIGRITTAGVFTIFSNGISPGAVPDSIAPGSDSALWFTEVAGNRIGRITTAGVVTEFSTGLTPGFDPDAITTGPDGNLWFVGLGSGLIGRITPFTGLITEFPGANRPAPHFDHHGPRRRPLVHRTGRQQDWQDRPDDLSRWSPEYAGPLVRPVSDRIITGPDFSLWVTGEILSTETIPEVTRISVNGTMTSFATGLTLHTSLVGILTGPDGNLYFAENNGDRIGQSDPPQRPV